MSSSQKDHAAKLPSENDAAAEQDDHATDADETVAQTRIRSVSRAATLLMLVASAPEPGYSARELASRLGTTLPTTYHLLNTLLDSHLVSRDENRQFRLGHAVGVLADEYYRQSSPPASLLLPLQALTEATGETAYLSAWRHGELEILAVRSGTHAVRVMNLMPGFHENAHARASGKLLLAIGRPEIRQRFIEEHELVAMTSNTIVDPHDFEAELDAIAVKGYATDEEEFYEGVSCIAAPIVQDGFLIGAYTLSSPVSRYRTNRHEYLEQLRSAAKAAVQAKGADQESAYTQPVDLKKA